MVSSKKKNLFFFFFFCTNLIDYTLSFAPQEKDPYGIAITLNDPPINFHDCLFQFFHCSDHTGVWPYNKDKCVQEFTHCEYRVEEELKKNTVYGTVIENSYADDFLHPNAVFFSSEKPTLPNEYVTYPTKRPSTTTTTTYRPNKPTRPSSTPFPTYPDHPSKPSLTSGLVLQSIACGASSFHLRCEDQGRILIKSSVSAKSPFDICPLDIFGTIPIDECTIDSLSEVSKICNGKKECRIESSQIYASSSCSTYSKYHLVEYTCSNFEVSSVIGSPSIGSQHGISYVLDGKISLDDKYFYHSKEISFPWLQIDLGNSFSILKIKVALRQDCCWQRFTNVEIRIGDFPVSLSDTGRQIQVNSLCATYNDVPLSNDYVEIQCNEVLAGRYVTLQILGVQALMINEIYIYIQPSKRGITYEPFVTTPSLTYTSAEPTSKPPFLYETLSNYNSGNTPETDTYNTITILPEALPISKFPILIQEVFCDYSTIHLSCNKFGGSLTIIEALLGRQDDVTCVSGVYPQYTQSEPCLSSNLTQFVSERCDNKKSCSVFIADSTEKYCEKSNQYLRVTYGCSEQKLPIATASSSLSYLYKPHFVLDGYLSLSNANFFHSEKERYPWLQLDLGDSYYIGEIQIFMQSSWTPISNLEIRIGNTPIEYPSTGQILSSNGLCATLVEVSQSKFVISCDSVSHSFGRYITFQLLDIGILKINEILVFIQRRGSSKPFPTEFQSSTLKPYTGNSNDSSHHHYIATASSFTSINFHPSLAVDGDINPFSFFESKPSSYPWLQLDFSSSQSVKGLSIVLRKDCCWEEFHDIEVRVGNYFTHSNYRRLIKVNEICSQYKGPSIESTDIELRCEFPLEGRYLTIQRTDYNTEAVLSAVEIFVIFEE